MELNSPVPTFIMVGVQNVLNSDERIDNFTRMTHHQWAEWMDERTSV